MSENPFQSPSRESTDSQEPRAVAPPLAAYNLVSDTVTGVNVRWSDNRFQAICIVISMASAALVAALFTALNPRWDLPWYWGAAIGAFFGLVVGGLGSGIYLMVYRALRHLKGKHD